MKLLKNESGVTLIVLVVTIIILLVLATVGISAITGENGIIAEAQKVKEDAKRVEIIENIHSALAAEEAENPDEPLTLEQIEKVLNEHGTVNKTENGVFKSFTSEEIEIPIEEFIEEDVDLELAYFANPGDYVEYNDGLWRVLYNDSNNGLQIILDGVGDEYTVSYSNYNEAIDLLNIACQRYINTEFAYSARSVGSNPIVPNDKTTSFVTFSTPKQSHTISAKVADNYSASDLNAMKNAGISNVGNEYWLASRSGNYNITVSTGWYVYCYMSFVNSSGAVKSELMDSIWCPAPGESGYYGSECYDCRTVTKKIRPVVNLKSSVLINTGDGSENNPYKLTK